VSLWVCTQLIKLTWLGSERDQQAAWAPLERVIALGQPYDAVNWEDVPSGTVYSTIFSTACCACAHANPSHPHQPNPLVPTRILAPRPLKLCAAHEGSARLRPTRGMKSTGHHNLEPQEAARGHLGHKGPNNATPERCSRRGFCVMNQAAVPLSLFLVWRARQGRGVAS
jgi:hypothetical protein